MIRPGPSDFQKQTEAEWLAKLNFADRPGAGLLVLLRDGVVLRHTGSAATTNRTGFGSKPRPWPPTSVTDKVMTSFLQQRYWPQPPGASPDKCRAPTGTIPMQIAELDVLAEHEQGEQHAERRHQEVIRRSQRSRHTPSADETTADKPRIDPPSTRKTNAPNSRALGTISPTLGEREARTAAAPARRRCSGRRCRSTRLPFGASSLNRMVPATIDASDASVNRMPCRLSWCRPTSGARR